jgi:hypothetical protein
MQYAWAHLCPDSRQRISDAAECKLGPVRKRCATIFGEPGLQWQTRQEAG